MGGMDLESVNRGLTLGGALVWTCQTGGRLYVQRFEHYELGSRGMAVEVWKMGYGNGK